MAASSPCASSQAGSVVSVPAESLGQRPLSQQEARAQPDSDVRCCGHAAVPVGTLPEAPGRALQCAWS